MNAAQRSMRARIANHGLQAKYSGTEISAPARAGAELALNRKLALQYDIDPLDPDYPTKLRHARSAYYSAMALRRSLKASKAAKHDDK